MRHLKHLARLGYLFLLSILIFGITACAFPSAMRLLEKGEKAKAIKKFQSSTNHRIYGTGAEFMLARLGLERDQSLENWMLTHQTYCDLQERSAQLPIKTIFKLRRYEVAGGNIQNAREHLLRNTKERLFAGATIAQLLLLEENSRCWSEAALDSVRRVVVNKNINSRQAVYDPPLEEEWVEPALGFPTEQQLFEEVGYSAHGLLEKNPWGLSYAEAERIQLHYHDKILPTNYGAWWEIQYNSWDIFQRHNTYCDMDSFAVHFPRHKVVGDCWYEAASEVLCGVEISPLLAFHRENAHTALDWEVCEQIAFLLVKHPEKLMTLNADEQQQLADIMLMLRLRGELLGSCSLELEDEELISTVVDLARRYQHHKAVFVLGAAAINHFACEYRFDWSRKALDTLQPFYPDSMVCIPSFEFQVGKQAWFDGYREMLDRYDAGSELPGRIPERVAAWSTPLNDEYSLVSFGQTKEVFFMRREQATGNAQVMQSVYSKDGWTIPRVVPELFLDHDMELLSIGKDGRKLLMRSKGKLWQSYREEPGRKWYEPRAMSLGGRVADYGWLSDNDSLLYLAYYENKPDASWRPDTDLGIAKLEAGEQYPKVIPLGEEVNFPQRVEQRPVAALGGRMLFFTSDRPGGVGKTDMFRVNFSRPGDGASVESVLNLGLGLNTMDDDFGITYFSEYAGLAYYHGRACCGTDLDIWKVQLGPELFPNALRLAGVVVDENGQPLSGGFLEFTPNFQLNVHAQPLSKDGTYVYTVPDSTEVVRLFPEIPGYYSEKDATHHLAQTEPGQIIRDTFVLISFDYIRKNFRLEHSTFYNGTADFDQPELAYPEITRLAQIANRMGAELELTGHTDDFGTAKDNEKLSWQRAESVKKFLVQKCGFDAARIHTYGMGATAPVGSNNTDAGRRANRRIEIVFRMPELEKD
jgi:outer membrane protein OmpA-like peptidoglycan-associated protein